MPQVDDSRLQRRYSELASQLTACWTYERFHHRLRRLDVERRPESRFESIHGELKSINERLSAAASDDLVAALDRVESELRQEASELLAEDSRISASDLRRFLSRVRRLDEEVLLGLLRFYVFAHRSEHWESELVDKVDFLLSRLGEEVSGPLLNRDRVRLRAALSTLWSIAGVEEPQPTVLSALRSQVQEIRREIDDIADLDALEESRIISRYRRLKHGLGRLLVEASVAEVVLEVNAAISRTVRRLHTAEEWQIAADFARLREVETGAGLGEALSLEIESLRRDMEVYEESRRWDDVRLETLHRLRRQFRQLRPHLQEIGPGGESGEEPDGAPKAPGEREETAGPRAAEVAEGPAARPARSPADLGSRDSELRWELVGQLFDQLETVVGANTSLAEAEEILQDPSLPFDLEQLELEAFLAIREGSGAEVALERLLFTAAAVRHRLVGLRDPLEAGVEGGVVRATERALALGEQLLEELEEAIAAARVEADEDRAGAIRFLRVLLMRDYATLWIEARGLR